MYKLTEKNIDLGDGRIITIETGKLAKQADGAVVVKLGKTMLLATVVAAVDAKADADFMPLSVEYKEKFSSSGRFPGGFMKRESRPGDYEILISRLIDRALRPLFPDDYHSEVFVNVSLISADTDIAPDSLAGLAASTALSISSIPFNGPVSEVRVARINGQFKVNPNFSELKNADIDIIVGATKENITMVEGEMSEVSEKDMIDAIRVAHDAIKIQCIAQEELAAELGIVKRTYNHENSDPELKKRMEDELYAKLYEAAGSANPDKHGRRDYAETLRNDFITRITEEKGQENVDGALVKKYFHDIEKDAVRNTILEKGVRLDGRKTNEIRPIWCEIDYLPATHGSAIFTRGETQSLTSVTLGTKMDEKMIDEVLFKGTEKFTLHYNFPPFATGEAKPYRGVGRREVGHGNLAHRALKRMMPDPDKIPYTVRIVSDILESNGSSSMATVCAGTLALMDAGIKIKRPVSGIAMGLITDKETGKWAVLSDILGDEDHLGDMDFKVTGTVNGITATQMDIKTDGLSFEILTQALEQARIGRLHILEVMLKTISQPREDYKPHAPRIERIEIPKELIGAVIGPGGKIIQEIQAETGTTIAIEEADGKGIVYVSAVDKASIDAAMQRINRIVAIPELNKVYKGKVKAIVQFGAFVEIMPGKEGLLHISEIEWRRLNTVEEVLKEGDEVEVKLIEMDIKTGKLKLSRKVLLPRPERKDEKANNSPKS